MVAEAGADEVAAPRQEAAGSRRDVRAGRLLLLILGVFVVALAPRLVGLDLFPTSDEDSWMRRTGGFTFGLVNGQLGRTYQNGHPGVTTMWIGLLSQGPDGALRFADRVHGLRYVAQVPGYLDGLARARVGFAVLGALAVAVTSWYVARLFGLGPAVLAGGALAAEPFLVANQQLVHVDGPLVAFVTLAVLATLDRWTAGGGRGAVVVAGLATGLALLSKSPALFLLGYVPLVAVGSALLGAPGVTAGSSSPSRTPLPIPVRSPSPSRTPLPIPVRSPSPAHGRGGRGVGAAKPGVRALPGRAVVGDLALWGAIAIVTVGACWPALWALGPAEVLTRILAFTRETGGQPDEVGSFFLGRVGDDPGPFYYVVSTAFRMSPCVMVGLVLALAAAVGRHLDGPTRARAGWLAVFVGGFALMMTLGPKKFDRYLLPVFPGLVILAALGWWAVASRALVGKSAKRLVAGAGLILLLAFPLASTTPYPLSYYNPLLGGGAAAQRAVMIGNGEGLDQAARWLNAQPNAAQLRVAAHSWDILAALVPADGEPLREGVPDDADFIVTYGRRIQMHRWGPSLDRYFTASPPVHTVWINGIEYVRIHPGPHRGRGS